MDRIDNLINRVHPSNDCKPRSEKNTSRATCTNTTQTLTHNDIRWLWKKMAAMFGHRWESSFGVQVDPEGIWLDILQGLTHSQLNMGVECVKASGRDWPPGAPEFRTLCLPNADSLGLPSETAAYSKFCVVTNTGTRIKWEGVHPAIYYAYRQLDSYPLKHLAGTNHRNMFIGAYREAVKKAATGFEFPPVPIAIEHQAEQKTAQSDRARTVARELASIRKRFNI